MIYYPIAIPTLNRYEHLRRCIESLSKNTHASETELYIALDYPPNEKYVIGYEYIKKYIPTIKGFKEVFVYERDRNYGVNNNIYDLYKEIYKKYDALIFTEDDNEFSPCFLDYMDKALERYKSDSSVSSISGYNRIGLYQKSNCNIMAVPYMSGWGIGMWKDKTRVKSMTYYLNLFRCPIKLFKCANSSPGEVANLFNMIRRRAYCGDVCGGIYNRIEKKVQIVPTISMVRNWGQDGSGVNCGFDDSYKKQEININNIFELDNISTSVNKSVVLFDKYYGVAHYKMGRFWLLIKIAIKYIIISLNLTKIRNEYESSI